MKLHDDVRLDESVAVQMPLVSPAGKNAPEAGTHVTYATFTLSLACGVNASIF